MHLRLSMWVPSLQSTIPIRNILTWTDQISQVDMWSTEKKKIVGILPWPTIITPKSKITKLTVPALKWWKTICASTIIHHHREVQAMAVPPTAESPFKAEHRMVRGVGFAGESWVEQGVNVPNVSHHPTIGDTISNRYLMIFVLVMWKKSSKREIHIHLPTPNAESDGQINTWISCLWSMRVVDHGSRNFKNQRLGRGCQERRLDRMWMGMDLPAMLGVASTKILNSLKSSELLWNQTGLSKNGEVCVPVCPSKINHLWTSLWFTHSWRRWRKPHTMKSNPNITTKPSLDESVPHFRWGTRWQSTAAHTKESLWATTQIA